MNKKYLSVFFLLSVMILLIGCGRDKALEEYKSNMETFYSDIAACDLTINSIDVESDSSVQDLLTALDNLEASFTWMASLPIPDEFASIEILAAESSEYMTNAVVLYHQAYESEPFDITTAQTAKEYYDRANKRVMYILSILHGEIPDVTADR